MRIAASHFKAQIGRPLAPLYLVFGQEPLLIEECCDEIRRAAREQGYTERVRLGVERGFDWNTLNMSAQALSLFATRRLIELRLPTGKPGDAGAKALSELAGNPIDTNVLLVIAGRIERRAQTSRWFKAIERAGVIVEHPAASSEKLLAWMQQRLRAEGLQVDSNVAHHLSYMFEGNLLAAAQEIRKLALVVGDRRISVGDIDKVVVEQARFNVYGLVDACLDGDVTRSLRILFSLRREGVEPVLISWALAREARALAGMSARMAAGQPKTQVLKAFNVWTSRARRIESALRRESSSLWLASISRLAAADRMLKGRESVNIGGGIWGELEAIVLMMSGWTRQT